MIIESHAHYSHKLYDGEYSFLDCQAGELCHTRGTREGLLSRLKENGIVLCIEPSTGFDKIEQQLAIVEKYHPYLRLALGVHPGQCAGTPWEAREVLREYVLAHDPIAIGETGLDYYRTTEEEPREYQKMWFRYQIELADERELPLILHVRDANGDALQILSHYRCRLHGGVAHCFGSDYETAIAYINLGFALGIGGWLLQGDERSRIMQDMVKRVPLTSLLVETDAPYLFPEEGGLLADKPKKMRNTSMLLPHIVAEIARLRGETYETVEKTLCENTKRVFRLNSLEGV